MDKKERFKAIFSFLKNKGKIHNQADLAKKIGASEATISKALKGDEKSLTDSLFQRINKAFDNIFSLDWMIDGYKKNADAPFMLSEPEPSLRTEQEKDERINFLEQQLKLEQQKNELLQQQLNLYENRVWISTRLSDTWMQG